MTTATLSAERATLEQCARSCLSKLQRERDAGEDLNAALTEADLNSILEQLQEMYEK